MKMAANKTVQNTCLLLLVILFVSSGLLYSFFTPLWSPPDEERHFAYCEYIAQNHKLPSLIPDDEGVRITEVTHPPLYYLIGSLFCREDGSIIHEKVILNDGPGIRNIMHPDDEARFPYSGKAKSAHLIRVFSIVLGAINVGFIFLFALKIFPGEVLLAFAVAVFVAANAQFLHISASVSNEIMSSTLCTILLYNLFGYLKGPVAYKHNVVTGILLGCALLTKISTIIYVPVTLGVLVWSFVRKGKNPLGSIGVLLFSALCVCGWWYVRNWIMYGDPTFSKALVEVLPFTTRNQPVTLDTLIREYTAFYTSFFGYFGAFQVPIPGVHLTIYGIIIFLGIAGLVKLFISKELTSLQNQLFITLMAAILIAGGLFVLLNIKAYAFMGKYLFIVIAPLAILICVGFRSVFPLQVRNYVLGLLIMVFVGLNAHIFFKVLKPGYIEPRLIKGADQQEVCCWTDQITPHNSIGQTFTAKKNNLCALRVMFYNHEKSTKKGTVTFYLKEANQTGRDLYQIDLEINNIHATRFFFIFPPCADSAEKQYEFGFRSTLTPGKGISLWYEKEDCYPEGHMLANGKAEPGDLYFTAYYFTGSKPLTEWEGVTQTVKRQGEYVGVRELQLYVEMPKKMRERSLTHKKMIRAYQ